VAQVNTLTGELLPYDAVVIIDPRVDSKVVFGYREGGAYRADRKSASEGFGVNTERFVSLYGRCHSIVS
jgi:hypothetical protein